MNITRCGKEQLVLTVIVGLVSLGGFASAIAGVVGAQGPFEYLPILAISVLGAVLVLQYRRRGQLPKGMFYLWVLPQALYLEVAVRLQGEYTNVIPVFSILGKGFLAFTYRYDPDLPHGVAIGVYGLSFLLLAVFVLFLEEWDDEAGDPVPPAWDGRQATPRDGRPDETRTG